MARSTGGEIGSVSVAVLLVGSVSVTPGGVDTVAVFDRVPVADADNVPVSVNVAVPPTSRFTDALMFAVPVAGQLLPGVAAQVHVTPVSTAGTRSVTVAPMTALGPLFVATMV